MTQELREIADKHFKLEEEKKRLQQSIDGFNLDTKVFLFNNKMVECLTINWNILRRIVRHS